MDSRIIVCRSPGQTRVAVQAGDTLTDLYIDRDHDPSRVGGVYLGRVGQRLGARGRVLVDVGGEIGEVFVNRRPGGPWPPEGALAPIQIRRDAAPGRRPLGGFLPVLVGRYLTLSVADGTAAASAPDESGLPAGLNLPGSGWRGRSRLGGSRLAVEDIRREADDLARQRDAIALQAAAADPGACLLPPSSALDIALRERPSGSVTLTADNAAIIRRIKGGSRALPADTALVHWQRHQGDLFEKTGVSEQLDAALARRSPAGDATITIDPAEALTAIDVDTGRDLAARGAWRAQLTSILDRVRLLNLGGLLAVDLPGSGDASSRKALEKAANEARRRDPMPLRFEPPGAFNVMLFSRAQARRSLLDQLFETGCMSLRRPTAETVALAALAAAERFAVDTPASAIDVKVSSAVQELLAGALRPAWVELSASVPATVRLAGGSGADDSGAGGSGAEDSGAGGGADRFDIRPA